MMKAKMILMGLAAMMFMFQACTKDNVAPGKTNVTLIAKGSDQISTLKSATLNTLGDTLAITDFLVHVRKIEFETEDHSMEGMEHMEDSTDTELEFEGSYLFDLVNDGSLGEQVVGMFEVPNNVYNKLEVDMYKYPADGENTLMQGKTFYIAGSFNGQAFEFWSDLMDELEVEFPDSSSIDLNGVDFSLYIDFHIDQIRDFLMNAGFGTAHDGNGNGIIEINPENTDGNQDLYWAIKHVIKHSVDMDDDDSNENDDHHHGGDHS